jgi:hypothetical protein
LIDGGGCERNHDYVKTEGPRRGGLGSGVAEELRAWFGGRLPRDWFAAPPDIQVDREEITVVGLLSNPAPDGASEAERAAAAAGRIRKFREETRGRRMEIAREAEHRFRRKVSWGVTCGDVSEMFTTLSVPVMTRLRQSERRVLDTLVDAGVARSRSDALAWCVRLTGENADAWLSRLRAALRQVEEVRDAGPGLPGALPRAAQLVYTSQFNKARAKAKSGLYQMAVLVTGVIHPCAIVLPIPGYTHRILPRGAQAQRRRDSGVPGQRLTGGVEPHGGAVA